MISSYGVINLQRTLFPGYGNLIWRQQMPLSLSSLSPSSWERENVCATKGKYSHLLLFKFTFLPLVLVSLVQMFATQLHKKKTFEFEFRSESQHVININFCHGKNTEFISKVKDSSWPISSRSSPNWRHHWSSLRLKLFPPQKKQTWTDVGQRKVVLINSHRRCFFRDDRFVLSGPLRTTFFF